MREEFHATISSMETSGKRQKVVLWIALVSVLLSLVLTFGLIIAQVYVRWTVNQNFTFLGGGELETLTASTFILLLGLLYVYRPHAH